MTGKGSVFDPLDRRRSAPPAALVVSGAGAASPTLTPTALLTPTAGAGSGGSGGVGASPAKDHASLRGATSPHHHAGGSTSASATPVRAAAAATSAPAVGGGTAGSGAASPAPSSTPTLGGSRVSSSSSSLSLSSSVTGGAGAAGAAVAAAVAAGDDDNDDDAGVEANFVAPPAAPLICKIHNGVMRDPVIAKCGYSFCRQCLVRKIRATGKCPITDMPLTEADMWSNLALSEQIGELMVFCRYQKPTLGGVAVEGVEGCKMQTKLKERQQHEAACGFAPVVCPNSSDCGPLLATQVEAHLRVCANMPCPHRKRGCAFRGKVDQVKTHLETCRFEALKDLLNERDQRVELLEGMLGERTAEINEMKRTIEQLNARMDELEKNVIGSFQEKIDSLTRSMRDYGMHVTDLTSDVSHLNAKVGLVDDIDLYNHKFKCVGTYVGHSGPVWALALSGDLVFSGSSDLSIKAWDINRRVCVQTMTGHEGIIYAVAIIGRTLYSGSSDCTIKVWSLSTYELLKSVSASDNAVCTLAVRSSERPLLLSGSLKTVTVWDADQMTVVAQLRGHNHWVRALVVSGDRLYSGSYNMIMIWELDGFQCIRTITCQGGSVYSLAVDTVGQNLISGIYENRIDLWDLRTFQQKGSLNGHTATVYALATSTAGPNRLFSGSYDNTVKVWNLETFQCVQTLIRHTSSVAAVVYGKGKIFSAAADNQIKVWG